ncbi:NHL domain-containing protein [Tasmannia lanceolata]|uniref:NHL domain-containing protein n=1 Tax=Tasmannia lanceolata TaxID=3420 RepID=UPI004062C4A6
MPSSPSKIPLYLIPLLFLTLIGPTLARKRHVITIRSPNLYPESLTWDPSAQHFIVGSVLHGSIHSISDAGVIETLISDPNLPPNTSVLGLSIDSARHRLLAVLHAVSPLPPFDALAAYHLPSRRRLFLAPLSDTSGATHRPVANSVTVDSSGTAYVTSSAGNFIWKVEISGQTSILSRSPIFSSGHVYGDRADSWCGLNGIVHVRRSMLLAVQTNTGKLYRVDSEDGTVRIVSLTKDLTGADGIAMRSDGVAVIVASHVAWFLKSEDGWDEARVFDEIALEEDKFPTGVAIREDDRAYVLYGHLNEAILGNVGRMEFSIEEMESEREKESDSVWVFVLIGLGVAYLFYWKYMMWQLAKNMNKKRN